MNLNFLTERFAGFQRRVVSAFVLAVTLTWTGCGTPPKPDRPHHTWLVPTNAAPAEAAPARLTSNIAPAPASRVERPAAAVDAPPKSLAERLSDAAQRPPGAGRLYSFTAKDLNVQDALALFARSNDLNIVADPDVTGTISVDFRGLPLDESIDAILNSFGYFAEVKGALIHVRNLKTEYFTVDYLRLVRTGNGTTTANISSGSGSSNGGNAGSQGDVASTSAGGGSGYSSGSGDSTTVSINKSDSVRFWEELEEQVKSLLSPVGRLAINRMAGTVMVTDQKGAVDRIEGYLKHIKATLHRQVDLEAQIFEVVLSDEFQFGVDWQNVMAKAEDWAISSGGLGTGIPSSRMIVDNPIGGNTPSRPTLSLAITKDQAKVVVQALQEMGHLEVVSQPRIRTLNNQAAMIKVGTDKPFFRRNTLLTTVNGGTQSQSDVEVSTITIGTVLSLTPQISEDGWVTLDIAPVITRLVSTAQGPDESTAPEVDIKQVSSLVRIPQGSTVVIGGLIQNEGHRTTRKVPVLGDIPLLGYAFRGVYDYTRKTELVIFITPRIVD